MKQKYIKKVLMCEPTYFQVEYVINPWMKPGSVNQATALDQWNNLVNELDKQKVQVNTIKQKQTLPDMVFAADQGIVVGNTFIESNFTYPERQMEPLLYNPWFIEHKFNIQKLPAHLKFEGSGEALIIYDKVLIGTGFRTSSSSVDYLQEILNKDVIKIELVNPSFYHLDTCLFVLNREIAFFHPSAFSKQSQEILAKLFPTLIPLQLDEVNNFAANSLTTDHHVIMHTGNKIFKSQIENFGYKAVEVDISEFMKAGGGVHCLVQTIEEAYE